jgi:hypothetical protein
MEYAKGLSGADVFAARFKKDGEGGLGGTFVIKIEKVESIEHVKKFYRQSSTQEWQELIAPLCGISDPIDGFVAVAYEVAFQSFEHTFSLARVLDEQSSLPEDEVPQQIESFCRAFVDLHIRTDDINLVDDTDIGTRSVNYHLLRLMLEERRLSDMKSKLHENLPDWPLDTPLVNFDNHIIIINPIWYIQSEVWERLKELNPYNPPYYISRIHGDLHTENLICFFTKEGKSVCPKLIDFGQTRDNGIPLFDLAYLEFDIIRRVLNVNVNDDQYQWFNLLEYSMGDILPTEELKRGSNIQRKAARAIKFIYPIRVQVKRLLDDIKKREPLLGESLERVWWLATTAVGLNYARKGENGGRKQTAEERKAALLYAAYGLKKLFDKPDMLDKGETNPERVSWASSAVKPVLAAYIRIPAKQERDEVDVARLHNDDTMVDNTRKWSQTEVFVWPTVVQQKPIYDAIPQKGQAMSSALSNILKQEKNVLLLGNVGMGKTTILRYLWLKITSKDAEFAKQFPELAELLPIFVDLEYYAQVVSKNNSKDLPMGSKPNPKLPDFIRSQMRENRSEYGDTDFVEQQIRDGKVLYLLSDLDAIFDGTIQEKVAKEISDLTYRNANRFIVTSRPIGFKGRNDLYVDYATYTLSDFTDLQIQLFLTQWLKVECMEIDEVKRENEVKEKVALLWQFISKDDMLRAMVSNPLFLSIFALRHSIKQTSQFCRDAYFEHCTKFLLDQRSRRNGGYDSPMPEKLDRIMYALVFWMHERFTDKTVPRDELFKHMDDLLVGEDMRQNFTGSVIRDICSVYIDFMREKMGILIERSKEQYDFVFPPLKKYFIAQYVFYKGPIEFIKQHWDNAHWREIFRYMFGIMLCRWEEDEIKRFMHISLLDKGVPDHDLLFVAQYLIDNPDRQPSLEEEAALNIIKAYLTNASDGLRAKFSRFLALRCETTLVLKIKDALRYEPEVALQADSSYFDRDNFRLKKLIREYLELVHTNQLAVPDDIVQRSRMMMLLCVSGAASSHGDSMNWSTMAIQQLDQDLPVEVKSTLTILLGMLALCDSLAKERLLKALGASEWQISSAASYALAQLAKDCSDLSTQLFSRLQESTLPLNEANKIIDTFALIGGAVQPEVLNFLIEQFSCASSPIQRASVLAVGKIIEGAPSASVEYSKIQGFLLAVMDNACPTVREAAVSVIGDLSGKEEIRQDMSIIEALRRALSDADSLVKKHAHQTLERLGKPPLPEGDLLIN